MSDRSASSYDLIVIGGGPGGYVAAIRAAQRGLKTAIVERDRLGGVCLNWGCIPTKALLRSAEIHRLLGRLGDFGLAADNPRFDAAAVVKRSRDVAKKLSSGIAFLMKKNKIDVIAGHARFEDKNTLLIEAEDDVRRIAAPTVVIAVGARPRNIPGIEPGPRIWTYKEAMIPDAMPKSAAIVGSGAVGVEFASFYSGFGCKVDIVEAMERILPNEDEDIAAFVAGSFKAEGIALHPGCRTVAAEDKGDGVVIEIEKGGKRRKLHSERLIVAVGVTGNVENLGLEAIGVEVQGGHIVTDAYGRTGVEGVYAIGDVAGAPWLAHKASHEGAIAVEASLGDADLHPLSAENIPGCTYCTPQAASVGMTEAAARAAGHEIRVGRFPFQANGKALAMGESEGFVKVIFDARTDALLGAHMVGAEVTELIQGFAVARTLETTQAELMQTVFPHPTLSEAMHEAVLAAYDRPLHI